MHSFTFHRSLNSLRQILVSSSRTIKSQVTRDLIFLFPLTQAINLFAVFSYTHHRSAITPGRNLTEKCECEILVAKGDANDILIQLRGITQEYHLNPLQKREVDQLTEPFVVKLSDEGEVLALLTRANESITSLSIKNQVVHTVLLNKSLYERIVNNAWNVVEWDLTKLPFGVCNATVGVVNGTNDGNIKVTVEAVPNSCNVINLGGGMLTEESRFHLETVLAGEDFTLKERREDVDVVMTTRDSDKKAVLDYEYQLLLSGFEAKNDQYFRVETATEEHKRDELNELNLY